MATRTMVASTALGSTNSLATRATNTNAAPAKAVARSRPYKDFLTPALHRRFTNAALLVLIVCWVDSAWISEAGWLWRWFPLGYTGIRALLLFIPCLSVFIVRVANLHIGKHNTMSSIETCYQMATSFTLWHTLSWYVFSAWLFGEIYIWSKAEHSSLGWVDYGRAGERPRLNENPVQLRCFLLTMAVYQTGRHFWAGYDQVELAKKEQATDPQSPLSRLPRPLQKLVEQRWEIAIQVLNMAVLCTLFSVPIYYFFLRKTAWAWAYAIGRTLFHQLPSHARPSGIIHFTTQARCLMSSSLQLALLWEISNKVFAICVSDPPLKRGQPLTSEAGGAQLHSLNPNVSLINGLKSKKEVVRTFAFWELWEICAGFEPRRQTIFTEGEQNGDCTWARISQCCLTEIDAIKTRISASQQPAEYQKRQQEAELAQKQQEHLIAQQQRASLGMPKIANQHVQDGSNVFQRQQTTSFAQTAGNVAKKLGQSPGAQNPISPRARKLLEYGTDRLLTKEQQAHLSRQSLKSDADSYIVKLLQSPLGIPFRQTFARRVCAVVFGVPYSDKQNIVHAAKSLTQLAVCSIREDTYGRVAPDVAKIIRAFTGTIREVQTFVAGLPPSWTDVEFTAKERSVGEIKEVVEIMKESLGEILGVFAEYAASLGLSPKEVREAKEIVGNATEMAQLS